MFNYSLIASAFAGQIGIRNPNDPDIPNLDTSLTSSNSGLYMDDFHPMIMTDNLEAIAPDFDGFDYDSFSLTPTYSIGDNVISKEIAWKSKVDDNVNHTPAVGTYWETCFSDWLKDRYNTSINKMLNELSVHKKVIQNTQTYIDNVQLFDSTSRRGDTITSASRFVGFEIELKKYNNIKAVIDRIGLRFTQKQDFTLYLFHSSRDTAIGTCAITTTNGYDFEWKTPSEWELNYVNYSGNTDAGGKFYIGYFETDITGSAINKNYDFSGAPCVGCNSIDSDYFNLWSKYITVRPIEVANGNLNGTDLFDLSSLVYSWTKTWGLNIAISVKTDFTQMVINNKDLFTDPLGKRFAVDMISTMAYDANVRINDKVANGELKATEVLQGLDNFDGMAKRYTKAIDALAQDFTITPVLPQERRGVRYGAI